MILKNKRFMVAVGLLLLLILIFLGGRNSIEKGRRPQTGWSRSVMLGRYVIGSVGLSAAPTGENIYVVWPFDAGEGIRLRFNRLDSKARVQQERDLELAGQLRAPRLIAGEGGELHLFWSNRLPGERNWQLWYALLNNDGELLTPEIRLSSEEERVGIYEVVPDGRGGAIVTWGRGDLGPINLARISPEGSVVEGPVQVITEAEAPSLRVDETGMIHLAWLQERFIYYTRLDENLALSSPGQPVVDLRVGTGESLYGPILGVADGWVYLFWSILKQSGLEAGTAATEYAAFRPELLAGAVDGQRLLIMPDEEQEHQSTETVFDLEMLVRQPEEAWMTTDFILHPVTMLQPADQLAVAVAANQMYRQDMHMQIAVLVFAEGQPLGYAFASKTESLSDDPILFNDAEGHLHLAWREGAGGTGIFFASTASSVVAALNRLSLGDLVTAILQGGMESAVSVIFTPIVGFGWLLPGLLIMVAWKMFRDEEKLGDSVSWIPLVVSIGIFEIAKFATLPTIVTYVPFSAWLEVPKFSVPILRFGVPVAIWAAALWAATRVHQRRSQSAVLYYVVFGLVDAVLSLAIYGVNFLGVY